MNNLLLMGIGAQRTGSTSMFRYLKEHPDLEPPKRKETYYYAYNYWHGEDWYNAMFTPDAYSFEFCTYYIYYPLAPQRIVVDYPDMKFLLLLRDPVDRAISQYFHEIDVGELDAAVGIEELMDGELEHWPEYVQGVMQREYSHEHDHKCILARGRYAEQLKRWQGFFDSEQIFVAEVCGKTEGETRRTVNEIFRWIGLCPYDDWEYKAHYTLDYLQVSQATRERLRAYYKPHNEELFELLGRRFDWQ